MLYYAEIEIYDVICDILGRKLDAHVYIRLCTEQGRCAMQIFSLKGYEI